MSPTRHEVFLRVTFIYTSPKAAPICGTNVIPLSFTGKYILPSGAVGVASSAYMYVASS